MQEIRENDPVAAEEQNRPTSSPGGKVSGAITEEERWRLVELVNRHFGEDGQSEQTGSEWKMSVSYL